MGHQHRPSSPRSLGTRLAVPLLLTATVAAGSAPVAAAPAPASVAAATGVQRLAPAARAVGDNPLARRRWGVYKGRTDQAWQPYVRSRGENRRLLAKIALRPRATWFGAWTSSADIRAKVRAYIRNATGGDPRVLVQLTVFRVKPWEHEACRRLPTVAERAGYRQWIDRFVSGVGSAHAAVVLQPDGPFALCAPRGSRLPSHLIRYAARRLSALPHTSVYIDGGASDWPSNDPVAAANILVPAGVAYTRGFALNSTHYASTPSNIDFGTRVVAELARRGIRNRHFVINTSSNGRPFTFNRARGAHPDNAKACATRAERVCVTLGIPPTANVAAPRWRMSRVHRARALAHVDGYLWFGRPWLFMQASPFVLRRALLLARTTPF